MIFIVDNILTAMLNSTWPAEMARIVKAGGYVSAARVNGKLLMFSAWRLLGRMEQHSVFFFA